MPTSPKIAADGVNQVYDGVSGIFPSSTVPVPAGFPTQATTGVPSGVALKRFDGNLVITTPGTVIDGIDLYGSIVVRADNVVIRNSRITSTANIVVWMREHQDGSLPLNLLIEDVRIRGVGDCGVAVASSNYTMRRAHISGCRDGAKAWQNVVIEDSFIHDRYMNALAHADGIQGSGGNNVLLRHNTVLGPYREATSALIFVAALRPIDGLTIERNYLSGGAFTMYTLDRDFALTSLTIRDNVFETGSSQFGPWQSKLATKPLVVTGNDFG